ncbi:ABC transporter ATP-binding protein [Natrarchaeobius oligotrophus]|uniref:ABC transporter ATP-binding protein n=1 Tax=Natrarchaeobius chitinivorans TaxID=1679083 RepID=A0A3N6M7S5_NATCH|nr:ABC transporter ATP-binding protein [Natrarchaeobius chitinivorans]RQG99698.1 ABC transporter ATP-binding protein [Natrarchaeobius chitinivorans]
MTLAIETERLTKRFGSVTAIDDLSLSVPSGTVYGYLGPNGAGKSTTIDILLDLVRPSDGTARVFGYDTQASPVAAREQIGVLLDGFKPYPAITGREHVELAATARGVSTDPATVLARVGLEHAVDQPAGEYSKGMTKRLGLAMALVGDPDLLILDEPSTGLDPHGIVTMRELIRTEVDRGATVFFSSHLLDQVEAVADRVAIINDGSLLVEDSVESLKSELEDGTTVKIRIEDPASDQLPELQANIDPLETVNSVRIEGRTLIARCRSQAATATVVSAVEESQAAIDTYEVEQPSLEDIFKTHTDGDE